jgi:hypothetical protein
MGCLGLLLVRVIVPAWVLSGALFKFAARDPALLPKGFRSILHGIGLDLKISLAILLGIEFAAIAIMLFVPRLARLMAVFMLGAFILVLVNEMIMGHGGSCGCLGSFSPPPWVMLAIDLILLILVVAIPPSEVTSHGAKRIGLAQAAMVFLVASIIAFIWVLGRPNLVSSTLTDTPATPVHAPDQPPGQSNGGTDATPTPPGSANGSTTDPTTNPTRSAIPKKDWYELDTSDWVGRNIRDLDLVQYVRGLPDDVSVGDQYLIFYSRTCDHCQMLLEFQFGFGCPVPTTLVAVPENPEGFETDGLLDNPCLDCRMAELPTGVNWIMTPPLVVAISNGRVVCAQEAEDPDAPACLPFH